MKWGPKRGASSQNAGGTRRKERQDHGIVARERLSGLHLEGQRHLPVDDPLGADDTGRIEPGADTADHVLPPKMHQGSSRGPSENQVHEIFGISACGNRLETSPFGRLRRAVPDTPGGKTRKQTKPIRLPNAVCRGEDHAFDTFGERIRLHRLDPLQRREHDLDIGPHPQSGGKALSGGGRSGDDEDRHGRAIVRIAPECYLRRTQAQPEPMTTAPLILGLESSCDDTAAALVRGREILSSFVMGQADLHAAFGGVVPEIAARAHAEKIDLCVEAALTRAETSLGAVDAIAVTAGPGLIGGVLAGVMCAKGLAAATAKPLVGVNHLAGHALTPRLTDDLDFPYLILLVSGGHCQFLLVEGPDSFTRLGGTIDDAPGEAFDKTARLLGLPQPGGPSVEREAQLGDPARFDLPRPLLDRSDCNMSFSGLKTALLRARDRAVAEADGLREQDRADLCAAFQNAVTDILAAKSAEALRTTEVRRFAVAGGVAANGQIRAGLEALCAETDTEFVAPPLSLCTDNGAMIAYAGGERLRLGLIDDLTLAARPRWPLDTAAPALLGSGKKGAKA